MFARFYFSFNAARCKAIRVHLGGRMKKQLQCERVNTLRYVSVVQCKVSRKTQMHFYRMNSNATPAVCNQLGLYYNP